MENHTRERSLILCRRLTGLVVAILAIISFAACSGKTESGSDSSALTGIGVPRAGMSLSNASATMTQTSDTAWTLSKTGSVSGGTVMWTVTATQGQTVAGHLAIYGQVTLTNSGAGAATLGNVVVNLQTKSGSSWVTQSSDVADATHGDAATTAQIGASASSEGLSTFTENPASGHLLFMNANTKTDFPLVPEVSLASGATVTLQFSAGFDNNVLNLPDESATRAEVIFSFGNAAPSPVNASNVDINGNGVIDPDEAWVRSVSARIGLTVPAQTSGDTTVTLSDTISDITTTGTVTFSNAVFNLGATSGTVSADVNGGASGGTITNCAHLTSSPTVTIDGSPFPNANGVNLKSCNTQTIGPARTCTPGAPGCGWEGGDMLTYGQGEWGDPNSTAGATLSTRYATVYMATGGLLEVGISGAAGFSMIFLVDDAVQAYLPASGGFGPLTSDLLEPTSSSSGVFGGEVVALQLNVDFSDAGVLTSATPLGDLRICNFSPLPVVNGMTIRQVLASANVVLGGGSGPFTVGQATSMASLINTAFMDGNPSVFAQENLVNGTCPWQQGDMLTYNQTQWGDPNSTAGSLLGSGFDSVYGAAGALEIGISGLGGFSILLTTPSAVFAYLPAIGVVNTLNADLVDPTSSSSGAFGGNLAALSLNVDFSDTGLLAGAATLLGDLRICNLSALPVVNGQTVRQFLATANMIIGGGSTPFGAEAADSLASHINNAFMDGNPSVFAQENLVNGACP